MKTVMEEKTHAPCEICKEIPDSDYAYLDRDEVLSPASKKLEAIGEDFRRCPLCGTYYYYSYMPPGPGNVGDREDLDRFTAKENELVRPLLEATEQTTDLDLLVVAALAGEDEQIRGKARKAFSLALERMSVPSLIPCFQKLLDHPDGAVRKLVCGVLLGSRFGNEIGRFEILLTQSLSHEETGVRLNASQTLAKFYTNRGDFNSVKKLLSAQDESIQQGAAAFLHLDAVVRPEIASLFSDLARLLSDANQDIGNHVAGILYNAVDKGLDISPTLPALAKAISDAPGARYWGLKALQRMAQKKQGGMT